MHKKGNILTDPTAATRGSLRKFALLDKGPIRNGMWVALVALAVLIATAAFANQLFAQSDRGTIPQLSLTSDAPGELTVSWSTPSETPSDYRISWAPSSESYPSWKDANTTTKGNSYPTGSSTSLTFTGLTEGEIYKVRMRARYNAGQYANNPWSGPWASTTGTVSTTPVPTPVPEPTNTPIPDPTEEPVEETTPPTATLSATTPVEGKQLTATLVDPDDLVSGESWSWSSSTTTNGTFTAITGATSASYTPVAGDVGSYLRVTASYTDSSESEQSVSVDSTGATLANPSPVFADALVTFSVAEDAATDDAVGTVTATDPDNDTLTYSVGGTDAVEFDADFVLNATSGAITVKSDATIDHESKSSYAVTITATDTFNRTDTVDVTITVDEPQVVPGQSNSEPAAGDLPGTSDTTGLVTLDQAARGRLTETAALWDTDWFAADLTAGSTYRIQVLGTPGVDCTLLAPIVESLHDASGTVVAGTEWSDESRELWSRLTFTPTTDARYYISVVGEANYGGLGTYIVALTDGGSGSDDRITAIGSQGCVPEAPAGLGLSEVTAGSVTLSWTAPAHSAISGYRILRGTDASMLSVIATDTGSTATSYVDASVSPSTTYVYAVVALSAAGEGAPSVSASTTTPSPTPTNLTLTPSYDRVTLDWTTPSGDGVTGYRIWRGASAGALTVLVSDTSSTSTSYVDETVEDDTTYHYAVAALDANGAGTRSTGSIATLAEPRVTILPTPEPEEPLIAAQQQAADEDRITSFNDNPIVTFASNLGKPDATNTPANTLSSAEVRFRQSFTTGPGGSGFLLHSFDFRAWNGNDFLIVSLWTDEVSEKGDSGPGEKLAELGRVEALYDNYDYTFEYLDVFLFPSTKYWIQFQVRHANYDIAGRSSQTRLLRTTDTGMDTGGLVGWSFGGQVKFGLKGRVVPSGRAELPGQDFPASEATLGRVRLGEYSIGTLDNASDRDWFRIDGLEHFRQYRLEVDFLGANVVGGSLDVFSSTMGEPAVARSDLWDSNYDGHAVLDFWPVAVGTSTLYVQVESDNDMNREDDRNRYTGPYTITLSELPEVRRMVSNLEQRASDRLTFWNIGHLTEDGLTGHVKEMAIDFTTGSHATGYTLDKLASYIMMGRRTATVAATITGVSDPDVAIGTPDSVVVNDRTLTVDEGDTTGVSYTVKLSALPSADVTVAITGAAGTDLTVSPASLTFTSSNWDQTQTVTVKSAEDDDDTDDDVTLVHTATGGGYTDVSAVTWVAVRVDDNEDSATADEPEDPGPPAFPVTGLVPTKAQPQVAIYSSQSSEAPVTELCQVERLTGYETGLILATGDWPDEMYAGTCAGVTLEADTKYWVVFRSLSKFPNTFYRVAQSNSNSQDPASAAGWTIGNQTWSRLYTGSKPNLAWKKVTGSHPLAIGIFASPN